MLNIILKGFFPRFLLKYTNILLQINALSALLKEKDTSDSKLL